jgi:hypothetical protein
LKVRLLLLPAFLTVSPCWAQFLPFQPLTVDDGLPQSTVFGVFQEGTQTGAARFNGYETIQSLSLGAIDNPEMPWIKYVKGATGA